MSEILDRNVENWSKTGRNVAKTGRKVAKTGRKVAKQCQNGAKQCQNGPNSARQCRTVRYSAGQWVVEYPEQYHGVVHTPRRRHAVPITRVPITHPLPGHHASRVLSMQSRVNGQFARLLKCSTHRGAAFSRKGEP